MKISKNLYKSFWVIRLEGKIDTHDTDKIRDVLEQELGNGHHHVALDLSKTNMMESSTIGVLVQYWRRFQACNGELIVVNPNKNISKVLNATKLDALVRIVKSTGLL